ncbi:helix-turn-helix transcriptional regulator [Clostridium magnum]|uniref:Helix-turn-helix protein n=1 Tax=Clostridium magnum DSM 2767 TaxID=1121326 RepID=A0A161W092_9CLOT|nr:helix-turn-helix transcriptional regulator [Clostridium magnum]KZL88490.1 helix-turn-helix protein [Clostridium magnum DSM 2767]SHJ11516.1 Helix-turn-helix domain-containing protein [Clostridium magnum DSM 2767]
MTNLTLGTLIKIEKDKIGWTSTQLAEKLNISRQWLCDIEAGRGTPSLELLSKLDDIFPKAQIFQTYKKSIR